MSFEEWWESIPKEEPSSNKDVAAAIEETAKLAWQAAQQSQWQPIETAPKDESQVILRTQDDVFTGFWLSKSNYFGETGWHCEGDRNELWYSTRIEHPTHWMPLPEPPTE